MQFQSLRRSGLSWRVLWQKEVVGNSGQLFLTLLFHVVFVPLRGLPYLLCIWSAVGLRAILLDLFCRLWYLEFGFQRKLELVLQQVVSLH